MGREGAHLNAHRDANLVGSDTGGDLLLLVELLMGRRAWLENKRVHRSNVGKLRVKLESVDDLRAELPVRITLDTESEDAAVAVLDEELESLLMVRVRLETRVGDPAAVNEG
jgi:hypothetical protein